MKTDQLVGCAFCEASVGLSYQIAKFLIHFSEFLVIVMQMYGYIDIDSSLFFSKSFHCMRSKVGNNDSL